MGHPNMFADYLTFVVPPLAAALLLGRRILGTAFFPLLGICLWTLVALTLAMSRGGWISTGVAVGFVVLAGLRFGLVRPRQAAGFALCGVLLVGVLIAAFPEAIYRITDSDEGSAASRLVMIDQAELIISQHPILGVGLGKYFDAAKTEIPDSFAGLDPLLRAEIVHGVVHNRYLLLFAELGVIGLSLSLAMLWLLIRIPFTVPAGRPPLQQALTLGLAGSMVAQAVYFLFDNFAYDIRISVFYASAGLLVGVARPAPGRFIDGLVLRAGAASRVRAPVPGA